MEIIRQVCLLSCIISWLWSHDKMQDFCEPFLSCVCTTKALHYWLQFACYFQRISWWVISIMEYLCILSYLKPRELNILYVCTLYTGRSTNIFFFNYVFQIISPARYTRMVLKESFKILERQIMKSISTFWQSMTGLISIIITLIYWNMLNKCKCNVNDKPNNFVARGSG